MTPEGAVLHAVCSYLDLTRVPYRRMSTTGIPVAVRPGSKHRFRRNPAAGVADIIAWLPQEHGRICAIECKSATGRQSECQRAFQVDIEAGGGLYIIARSADDVRRVIG